MSPYNGIYFKIQLVGYPALALCQKKTKTTVNFLGLLDSEEKNIQVKNKQQFKKLSMQDLDQILLVR